VRHEFKHLMTSCLQVLRSGYHMATSN
jgi:hypothetical protein